MASSIKREALFGSLWVLFERIGIQATQFLITIFLARILSPNDYGIVAIVMAVILVLENIVSVGMSQALIQKKGVTESDYSTVFSVSLVLSIVLYLLLITGISSILGLIYEDVRLKSLLMLGGVVVIFDSLIVVQKTILEKELNFKQITIKSFPSVVISNCISIILALLGFGAVALVLKVVIQKAIFAFMLWHFSKWKPKKPSFDYSVLKELYSFGWKLQLSTIVSSLLKNIYSFIVGKTYSLDVLGFYDRANSFQQLVFQNLTLITERVSYPALCKKRNSEGEKFIMAYRISVQFIYIVVFPISVFLALYAKEVVAFVYGKNWEGSYPMLSILALLGFIRAIQSSQLTLFKVIGKTSLILKFRIIEATTVVFSIFLSLRLPIENLLQNCVIAYCACTFILSYWGKIHSDYPIVKQIHDMLPYMIGSAGIYLLYQFSRKFLNGDIGLLIHVTSSITFYILTCMISRATPLVLFRQMAFRRT